VRRAVFLSRELRPGARSGPGGPASVDVDWHVSGEGTFGGPVARWPGGPVALRLGGGGGLVAWRSGGPAALRPGGLAEPGARWPCGPVAWRPWALRRVGLAGAAALWPLGAVARRSCGAAALWPCVAVDPAYTSRWGAQHWLKPLTSKTRKPNRHDAAAVAIGRRALGHPIRRRTAPPSHDQSDRVGHRTVQARPGTPGREEPRPRIPGPRTRSVSPSAERTRATRTSKTVRDVRSDQAWVQDPLLLTE